MEQEKKNLLLMVPMLHQGGFERVCVKTARLMQEYYNVYILIFNSKNINYDVSGLEVIDINVPSKKGIIHKIINVLIRSLKTRSVKKRKKIDISYSFGATANYVNVLSKAGEKVITGLRCQTDVESARDVRLFCNRSDLVLSCSKEIVRQLESEYKYLKSECVYNPLDIEEIRGKSHEDMAVFPFSGVDTKVISCMARNDRIKGIWHLIKAFSLLQEKHPETRLVVVGAGNWDACKELSDKLGVLDKVYLPGLKKNPFPYVSASDIYVCSSNREGFPNAVLEAIALKKPVVSADCKTGPREILLSDEEYNSVIKEFPDGRTIEKPLFGEYGILVPDMDDDINYDPLHITEEERVLADTLSGLLDDEEMIHRYSNKSAERAQHFSPAEYSAGIRSVFEKIVCER